MFAVKINNRLVRDDRGHVYKYTSWAVAEAKARLMVQKSLKKEYRIIILN